jgi:CheY-specific phosphatase CheX
MMAPEGGASVQPDKASEAAPEVLAAFTEAAVTAFQELAGTAIEPLAPRPAGPDAPAGDVFASIVLRRPLPGQLLVAFPEAVLRALTERYLPAEALATPGILEDTAGEFANVIAGQAKTMLKGTLYHFLLSTPQPGRAAPAGGGTVLPFVMDAGQFFLRVDLPPCEGS